MYMWVYVGMDVDGYVHAQSRGMRMCTLLMSACEC